MPTTFSFDDAAAPAAGQGSQPSSFSFEDAAPPAAPSGPIGYIAQQAKAGLTADLPTIAGKALQYAGADSVGTAVRNFGEANAAQNLPDDTRGPVTRMVASAVRGAAPVVPIALANLTPAGPAVDMAAVPALAAGFGGAQAQDTLEKARAAGMSEDDAVAAARKTGLISGIGMGAVGAITGGAAAPLVRGLAGEASGFVRPFLAEQAGHLAGNVASMAASNAGVAKVEQDAGLGGPTPGEAALEGVGSAAGLTAALAPFGAMHALLRARAAQPGAGPITRAAALLTHQPPDQLVVFPDGTIGRHSEVESYLASLPPEERGLAEAKLRGLAPQDTGITTSPGAAPPRPEAASVEPTAPAWSTTAGAAPNAGGVPFERDIPTHGLGLVDPQEEARARAASIDFQPPDLTPDLTTSPGAAPPRTGLEPPAPEFNTSGLELGEPGPIAHAASLAIRPAASVPLLPPPAITVDHGGAALTPEQRQAQRDAAMRDYEGRAGLRETGAIGRGRNSEDTSQAPGPFTPGDIAVDQHFNEVHRAATSPLSGRGEPTPAQKEAGNYSLGHVKIGGLDISVENPQGSVRSGTGSDGKPWQTLMQAHYGYVRRSEGADGDHVDVFVKPGTPHDFDGDVYVVNQVDPKTGAFDEHKAVLGATSEQDARDTYLANYSPGWQGIGSIAKLPMGEFKKWVRSDDTKKPLGEIKDATAHPAPEAAAAVAVPPRDAAAPGTAAVAPEPTRAKGLRVGITPADAEPITVRDGIVHVGAHAALDYESGEPVKVPPNATAPQIAKALRDAGALSKKQRVFGAKEETPAAGAAGAQPAGEQAPKPPTARSAAYDRNPFLAFLATHGLYHVKGDPKSQKTEFSPDKSISVPGYHVALFRRNGRMPDALLQPAIEDGFLPKGATEAQLEDLIRRAVGGERVAPVYGEGQAEQEMQRRLQERAELHAHEVEAELPDHLAAELEHNSDSIPWLDTPSNTDVAGAMRALGFTEEEIRNAAQHAEGSEGTPATGERGHGAVEAAQGEGADHPGAREGAPAEAGPAEGLKERDLLGEVPNASQQEAARLKAQADEAQRRQQQAAPETSDFALSGSDRAADANPAQRDLLNGEPPKKAAADIEAQIAEMLDPKNPRGSVRIPSDVDIPESALRAQMDKRNDPGYTMGPPDKDGAVVLTSTTKRAKEAIEPKPVEPENTAGKEPPVVISPDQIDRDAAMRAHRGTSHSPDERGTREIRDYVDTMTRAWQSIEQRYEKADQETKNRVREQFEQLRDGYAQRVNAYLESHGRVISPMIAGPARFPVERNRKLSESAMRRAQEATEFLNKALKRIQRAFDGPVDRSLQSELVSLGKRVTDAEATQERMKAVNAALRKGDDAALKELGLDEARIAELKKPDFAGRAGYPDYALKNNNAEIRRLKQRVDDVTARIKGAEEAASLDAPQEENADGGPRVEQDAAENRVRVVFKGKPDEATRTLLKGAGFRWSPKNGAWQRQLTDAALSAAKRVVDGIKNGPEDENAPRERRSEEEVLPSGLRMSEVRDRINAMRGRMSVDQAQAEVDRITKDWKGGIDVKVVASPKDLPINDPHPSARGLYQNGVGYVVAGKHSSVREIGKTLAHEVIAHFGLRNSLGEGDWRRLMKQVQAAADAGNPEIAAARDYVRQAYRDADGKYLLKEGGTLEADEVAARLIEQSVDADGNMTPKLQWLKWVWAKVANFLRGVGVNVPMTMSELHGVYVDARRDIERGREMLPQLQRPAMAARTGEPAQYALDPKEALDRVGAALDRVKGVQAVREVGTAWDGIVRATAPQFRSPEALEAARTIINGMGTNEVRGIRFRAELEKAIVQDDRAQTVAQKARDLLEKGLTVAADKVFLRQSPEENRAFMQAMDTGDADYFAKHPNLKPIADVVADMFNEKAMMVQALDTGALKTVRENYFPHIWNREPSGDAQQEIFSQLSKRPLEGQKSFTKERIFEDVQAGLKAGFEPVSNNPLDLVMLKMQEMDKYLLAHKTLQALEGSQGVHLLGAGEKAPQGYTDINGRFGSIERDGQKLRYVARDDVAQVVNNYLSPSLYHNKYVGKTFTGYMKAANLLNQFQLGVFSAFHAGFTSMEAVISHASLGVKALSAGDLKGAAKYLGSAPAAWIENPRLGSKIIDALVNGTDKPEMARIVEGLEMAGAKWQMDERFRTGSTKDMLQAWSEGKKLKAGINAIGAITEQSARPILEWLVPRQKFGVFGEMYSKWMQDHPDASHEELRNQAQQIWNRVDSRLGQVVYDRLFVHNVAKNFAQMLVRAPGWTGGTILEIGGGIKDLAGYARDVAMGKKPESISDRAAYTLSMLMVTAIANATLTAMFTGQQPQNWKDLVAFRTGNLDEYGRPERFMLPTYMKDVYAYSQGPGTTLVNKAHPLMSLVGDVVRNRDYMGTEIRSEDASLLTQMAQTAGFAAKAFVPFWVKGVQTQNERQGSLMAKAAPLIGVMPSPTDLNKTPAEKLVSKYGADRLPQGSRTQEETDRADLRRKMYVALRKGDREQAMDLFRQGRQQGLLAANDLIHVSREARNSPLVNGFQNLTFEQAQRVMGVASPEEQAQLQPLYLRKRLVDMQRRMGMAQATP